MRLFCGSYRRTQAVLVPIATWEKLLEHAEDELDLDLAHRRLADRRPCRSLREATAASPLPADRTSRRSRRLHSAQHVRADAVTAVGAALDDLAHGRVTGKTIGERHVSGDLTGLASLKFDVSSSPTRRFGWSMPTSTPRRAVCSPLASVRNTRSQPGPPANPGAP